MTDAHSPERRNGQLDGIRVVDLTRVLSGPFCTQLLGDLGADVIKVETPDGDPVRKQGAIRDGESWYFAAFNRNKRSIVLNLREAGARDALAALIRRADVVVENFRPGVLAEIGFGWQRLIELKPDIVLCSISGFGQDGPYRDRPAFDFIAQAMSGFMSANGDASMPPLRAGLPISDLVAGLYAALGVCAALLRRRETGQPQHVDTAMLDGLLSFAAFAAADTLATGKPPERSGNDHPLVAPYGLFRASDGDVAIAPANDGIYARLLKALDLEHLAADPRFTTNALRMTNREAINALVNGRIGRATRAHWIEHLNRAGVPCGPVMSYPEILADPQVAARDMVMESSAPDRRTIRMTGFPLKFLAGPSRLRRPAPRLGEHTREILVELGLSARVPDESER